MFEETLKQIEETRSKNNIQWDENPYASPWKQTDALVQISNVVLRIGIAPNERTERSSMLPIRNPSCLRLFQWRSVAAKVVFIH